MAQNPAPNSNVNANDWKIDWEIDQTDSDLYQQTKQRYLTECPAIADDHESIQKQEALFKILAAGRKIGKPLLLHLTDSYTRSRIQRHTKRSKAKQGADHLNATSNNDNDFQHQDLTIDEWLEDTPAIKILTNNIETHRDTLSAAMKLFYARFNARISFDAMTKINDAIEPFARYIHDTLQFIQHLLNTLEALPPFQVDLWIIPKNVFNLYDDDEESDSDDYGDKNANLNEDDSKETDAENGKTYDIKDSLHGTPHVEYTWQNTRLQDKYKEFLQLPQIQQMAEYPHNRRLCIIADRRDKANLPRKEIGKTDLKQRGDKIYIYHPPDGNEIGSDHLHEKYIQLSYDCVLPKSKQCEKVTAKCANTDFFMLSFHVEAADEIRCYLYQRGQISRFEKNDILELLPHFFVFGEHEDGQMEKVSNDEQVKAEVDVNSANNDDCKNDTNEMAQKTQKTKVDESGWSIEEIAERNQEFVRSQRDGGGGGGGDVGCIVKDIEIPDAKLEKVPFFDAE